MDAEEIYTMKINIIKFDQPQLNTSLHMRKLNVKKKSAVQNILMVDPFRSKNFLIANNKVDQLIKVTEKGCNQFALFFAYYSAAYFFFFFFGSLI